MRLPVVVIMLALVACSSRPTRTVSPEFIGDPARGKSTILSSSCGACHAIPGVEGANGMVGPSLQHFARRTMVAGVLPNTPPNLIQWIRYPQSVVPGNAMPDVGLSEPQARDVAAYLYTLR